MCHRSFSLVCLLALLLVAAPAYAQDAPAEPEHNLAEFAPLDLPTPNRFRAANGAPGEAYWQQEVDYSIDVTLEPETRSLSGSQTITYTNNSPQTLEYLWLQLDQNLFDPESKGSRLNPADSRWSGAFGEGGYDLSNVHLSMDGFEGAADYTLQGTRMRIALPEPLDPEGGKVTLSLDYGFTMPHYGADRMGWLDVEQGLVFELAQWYPRFYVFDDVHGWNPLPYFGQGEFYLEYGSFDVSITVPHDYIVVATGTLENADEVLTDEQQVRLDRARTTDETVAVISHSEVGDAATRPADAGMLTWDFHAENARDFAWGASNAFIWDATSYEDVLVMSVYPREGIGTEEEPGWERAAQFSRHSIEFYSEMWAEYPYPVAINVAGIVGGMEYPMIVFCSVEARGASLFGVTDHEFGHQWFPMIVGSDERRHAWMDEGFNTFMNYYSTVAFYGDEAQVEHMRGGAYAARQMQSEMADQPVATYPDRIRRRGLGFLAYRKPGKGLLILRENILGPELFDSAFKEYFDRWAYRHPQPADFFRTIEDVAGEDLDWFWRGWFYSTDTYDLAIEEVTVEENQTLVTLENIGGLVLPPHLEVTYSDGRVADLRVPVAGFFTDDTKTISIAGRAVRVELDPEGALPDTDRSNDVWTATGE